MSKTQTITAQSFIAMLSRPQREIQAYFAGKTTRVKGDVELPRHVVKLPASVVFLGSFAAERVSLRQFNHRVKGPAYFWGLSNLRRFGPLAKFKDLTVGDCPLSAFNHEVDGMANFDYRVKQLKRFGPKTRFKGKLYARGTRLRSFNHEVAGTAEFSGVRSLKYLGPKARFHSCVYLGSTGIKSFNHPVAGNAYMVCGGYNKTNERCIHGATQLSKVGPKAVIKGNFIAPLSPISSFHGTVGGKLDIPNAKLYSKRRQAS